MFSKVRPKRIPASVVVAVAVALYAPVPFAAQQSSGVPATQAAAASPKPLDFEFFKTRVEPIFLKNRGEEHARCYACHVRSKPQREVAMYLEPLSPGSVFWTEEQSRRNFEAVSAFVVPGEPTKSILLMHPLAPEASSEIIQHLHNGGKQFLSQNDPDWQTMAEWVRGKKASGSSTP